MKFSTFQEMTIELDPNEQTRRSLYGSFFRILSATHDFEIGASSEDLITGFAGLGLASERDPLTGSLPTFSELHFLETQGIANTIRIIVGEGQVFDDRVVFGGTNVPVEVKNFGDRLANVFSPGAPKVVPAGGSVALSVSNADRRRAIYKNIGASEVALSTSGSYVGHFLAPGETFETTCTGALNAVSSGPAGLVSVLEEKVV